MGAHQFHPENRSARKLQECQEVFEEETDRCLAKFGGILRKGLLYRIQRWGSKGSH